MDDAMDLLKVDWLVYELYGLTEEEIGIVEGTAKKNMNNKIQALGFAIEVRKVLQNDYISITDIAKYKTRNTVMM